MRRRFVVASVLALSLSVAVPCSADLIVASGAGSTLATSEDLTALDVSEIIGTLDGVDQNDVSIFKIGIDHPDDFSAITLDAGPHGIPDTVLSLFDVNGVGIVLNDDISADNTLSCLPAAGVSNPCLTTGVALPTGIYYLAISRSANYPVDGSSDEIFHVLSSTDLVGPSSSDPLAGWDDGAFSSPDFDSIDYDIVLTGTVPEPATWPVTAGAVFLFALLHRRRAGQIRRSSTA